jgi:hypothetical protein
VEERRRADRDHDVVGGGRIGGTLAEFQASGRGHTVEQLLGSGLAPGHPPGPDRVEHRAIVVDAQHSHSAVGERERERQADPAEADHRDGTGVGHLRA